MMLSSSSPEATTTLYRLYDDFCCNKLTFELLSTKDLRFISRPFDCYKLSISINLLELNVIVEIPLVTLFISRIPLHTLQLSRQNTYVEATQALKFTATLYCVYTMYATE